MPQRYTIKTATEVYDASFFVARRYLQIDDNNVFLAYKMRSEGWLHGMPFCPRRVLSYLQDREEYTRHFIFFINYETLCKHPIGS